MTLQEKIKFCEIAAKIIAKKYRYDWEDLRQEAFILIENIIEIRKDHKFIMHTLKLRLIDFLRSQKHPGTKTSTGSDKKRKTVIFKRCEQISEKIAYKGQEQIAAMQELKLKLKSIGGVNIIKKRLAKGELIKEMQDFLKEIKNRIEG